MTNAAQYHERIEGRNRPVALRRAPGFTLIELVLVMVVITAALAIAAPSLRGFAHGAKMRDASTQLVAMCQWARTQAISGARVYRLQIEPASAQNGAGPQYRVMVQDGDQFHPPGNDFGQVFVMPVGYRLSMTRADGAPGGYIDFYPTGRTDPARIQILADDGEATMIECPTPAETFRVVATGEAAR